MFLKVAKRHRFVILYLFAFKIIYVGMTPLF